MPLSQPQHQGTMSTLAPNTKLNWNGTDYWVHDAGKSYSIVQTSSDTLRFEVRGGDVWAQGDNTSLNRSEIGSTMQIANGTSMTISYAMTVEDPGDPKAPWTVLGQLHQNDYAGAPNNSPPFAISIANGKMTAVIGYTNLAGQTVYKTVFADTDMVRVGHQYNFAIDIAFDPNGNGRLSLVRDGVKIAEYNGPLGYSTQSSVYWKEGIYRPASTDTMVVSYSNLSITAGAPIELAKTKLDTSYQVNSYGADGKLATTTIENADGSISIKSFDAAGLPASMVTANLNGTKTTLLYDFHGAMTQKTVTAADGARVTDTFGITGKSYVADHVVYDKTGATSSVTRYLADGQVELQQTFGKYAVTTYYQYDAQGRQTLKSVTQANGTREVDVTNIQGKDYVTEHRSYDAAGTMSKLVRYHEDGSLAYSQSIGASGATSYMTYDATGHLVRKTVSFLDGSRELTEYKADGVKLSAQIIFDADGALVKNTQYRADGTVVIYHEKVVGQNYASDAITYDASGKVILIAQYHADKTLSYLEQRRPDGATIYQKYDATGTRTQKSVVDADGSKEVYQYGLKGQGYTSAHLSYDEKGVLTHMVQQWDDGMKRVSDFGITGKSYVTENTVYDAKGGISSITRYHADGTQDYVLNRAADGSGTEIFYDAGGKQTLAISLKADGAQVMKALATDVTMVSGTGNDSFTSFGNDKFVFHDHFGKDTIYGFKAGDGPFQDTLQFDKAMVADFAHLNMVQQGSDVVISVADHGTVTLKAIALASLSSHDFLFA